jgi:predicted transposase YbfD/YdcC
VRLRHNTALVTIDAMGCQVEIADKIVAHKADYLLALKGNQPTLEGDVESYFGDAPARELVTKSAVEKGHGRIETRTYTASSNVDWIVSDHRVWHRGIECLKQTIADKRAAGRRPNPIKSRG